MFDTKITRVTQAAKYPQEIHEHRAPTDKSVELLMSMEKAAAKNLVSRCVINDNKLSGAMVCMYDDYGLSYLLVGKFILNGEVYHIDVKVDTPHSEEKLLEVLIKHLGEAVHKKLTTILFRELVKGRVPM